MSLAARHLAGLSLVACAGAMILAPSAAADPDIDSESAASVIEDLQQEGYTVQINGVPSGDTALLTTCRVTAINDAGVPSVVSVDVACPIQRG